MASLGTIDMDSVHDQTQSILFGKLPAEVRVLIFEYALTSGDDLSKPYSPDRVYYRPGYHFHQKVDYSLLLACKRIFRETRLIPVSQAEHIFWVFKGPWRAVYQGRRKQSNWQSWWEKLNLHQRDAVKHVHMFVQQCYLENLGLRTTLPSLSFRTKQLKLTLAYSDWWSWESPPESSDRLGICPWLPYRVSSKAMLDQPLCPDLSALRETMIHGTWGWQICQLDLEVLRIEFETDVIKKVQLDDVLNRAKHWRFPTTDGKAVLEPTGRMTESRWKGFRNVKDDSLPFLRPASLNVVLGEQREYHVAELMWRRTECKSGVDQRTEQGTVAE